MGLTEIAQREKSIICNDLENSLRVAVVLNDILLF